MATEIVWITAIGKQAAAYIKGANPEHINISYRAFLQLTSRYFTQINETAERFYLLRSGGRLRRCCLISFFLHQVIESTYRIRPGAKMLCNVFTYLILPDADTRTDCCYQLICRNAKAHGECLNDYRSRWAHNLRCVHPPQCPAAPLSAHRMQFG